MTSPPRELQESQLSESQRLKARGAASWRAAVAHPMVAGIGAGTLPHEVFRFYFEQNLGYLREYARAIALTLAGTTDREAMSILTRFLGQIVDVEIPANESFLTRLGGSPDQAVPLLPTAYSYTRHLLDVCRQGRLAVALAGLLPCQWSYGEIGQRLVQAPPADPVYADWIALFAGDGYDDLVTASTALLDRCGTAADQPATADAFDRSTRYEVAFWQMAYTRGESDALHPSRANGPHRTASDGPPPRRVRRPHPA
jgi:thiaminase (transcriptional activator TenA)